MAVSETTDASVENAPDVETTSPAATEVAATPSKPEAAEKPAPAPKPSKVVAEKPAKTTEKKAEKPAPAEKAEKPDAYADLALPDGSELKPEVLGQIKEFASKHGLSLDAAKDLLAAEQTRHESLFTSFDESVEKWKADLVADLGSEDEMKQQSAYADAFLERFAGPGSKSEGLHELLQDTGFAYYGKLFHALAAAGKALSEPGKLVNGKSHRTGTLDDDGIWAKNFPNSGERPSKRAATAHMSS